MQGTGLGGEILAEAFSILRDAGCDCARIDTHRENRRAVRLYEKNGYLPAGFRHGYYSAPKEDAVLMTKEYEHAE